VADNHKGGGVLGPYRTAALAPREPPRRRKNRLRRPIDRALFGPLYVGTAFAAVPGIALGLLNAFARVQHLYVVPPVARVEDCIALALFGTLPLVGCAVLWNTRRFSAPRATKRRYVTRLLVLQGLAVAIAMMLTSSLRPAELPLLATATRADGRTAYVHRFWWGCGYRLSVTDDGWTARDVTYVGPFACEGAPPRVEWHGDEIAIVAADGERIGSWAASDSDARDRSR
jgi:hypothetical protein